MTAAAPLAEPIARWATGADGAALWLNATGLDLGGCGILLLGASGSGKSSVALALMASGARLVADDGLWVDPGPPAVLRRPEQAPDLIEARGVGLIHAGPTSPWVPVGIVVDLDRAEPDRLPPRRYVAIGTGLHPLILGGGNHTLAPALTLMARHGRAAP